MTVYLFHDPDAGVLQLFAPAVSEDGRLRGRLTEFVRPGEDFEGWTYDRLVALGNGRHELAMPAPREPVTAG